MSTRVRYHATRDEVRDWLIQNIDVDQVSPSGLSGKKGIKFVWRLGLVDSVVLFENEIDAVRFILRWG